MFEKHLVFIGLGSNLGDRLFYLENAIKQIHALPETKLIACASVYESPSFGFKSNLFLNTVIIVESLLQPSILLSHTQKIESKLGRNKEQTRTKNYTARTIDIDLLLFGNKKIKTEDLILPHPEIHNRAFVLKPLLELKKFLSSSDILNLETNFKNNNNNLVTPAKQESKQFFLVFEQLKHPIK